MIYTGRYGILLSYFLQLNIESNIIMLELIRHYSQSWLAKAILGLIAVTFGLFGIDSYLTGAGQNAPIAKLGDQSISIAEYGNAMERQRVRLMSQNQNLDPKLLDTPAFKQSVLEDLMMKRLVNAEAKDARFKISDAQLNDYLLSVPELQEDGQFSHALYQQLLEQNGQTAGQLEASIRNDLLGQQVHDDIAKLAFVPEDVAALSTKYQYEARTVSTAEIKVADFKSEIMVNDEEAKQYYEKHQAKFNEPEKVKVEFVLLSAAGLLKDVAVSDEQVKAFYDQNQQRFQGDEKREASHILISFGVNATDEDKQKAKEKAEELYAILQAAPERFEELATKHSQDPGSATKGGSLGSFGRGTMVKPFEEAVFAMDVNQISDIIQSDFGYHIIRLDGVSGNTSSFEEMKPKLKAELLFQEAQIKYASLTEEFSNIVYEQSGSLEPVAEAFKLEVQQLDWMSRKDLLEYFKNSNRFVDMVFSDDVIKDKRNTNAEEVAPNNMVAARVIDYQAEKPQSFEEVKEIIVEVIKLEKAVQQAEENGKSMLAKLEAGETLESLEWIPEVTVDRKNAQGLTESVMSRVYTVNAETTPAFTGFIDEARAYVFIKVSDVLNPLAEDEDMKKMAQQAYTAAMARAYVDAYGRSLKAKTDIQVNAKLLQSNDN